MKHITRCAWCRLPVEISSFHAFGMTSELSLHLAACPTRKYYFERFRAKMPTLTEPYEYALKRLCARRARAQDTERRARAIARMMAHKQKIRDRRAEQAARKRAARRYVQIENAR